MIDAESAAEQTRLLPNPNLEAAWSTIPVGPRNPPDQPFGKVPSYSVGVSQFVELGKRGPRRRLAEAVLAAERYRLESAYRQTFFAVLESLADQAAATARRGAEAIGGGQRPELGSSARARRQGGRRRAGRGPH